MSHHIQGVIAMVKTQIVEKDVIEHLILFLDQRKQFQLRDDLISVYVKYWPQRFGESCLFEIYEKLDTTH